jgi:hypothetical protein
MIVVALADATLATCRISSRLLWAWLQSVATVGLPLVCIIRLGLQESLAPAWSHFDLRPAGQSVLMWFFVNARRRHKN